MPPVDNESQFRVLSTMGGITCQWGEGNVRCAVDELN